MSSLTKRATSKFWVACFTDRNGRRLKKSTATTDRKKAQKIADVYEEVARRKHTALQARRVIADLHLSLTGEALTQTSVRSFFDGWLEKKRPETAQTTQAFYRSAATKFVEFLGPLADTEIAEIAKDHILRFRNEQAGRLAPKTVNQLLKFLRMAFRAARRDALISDDPTEFVDAIRQQKKGERRPFTVKEIQAVLAVADEEWRGMILFGLYTGQRLSDIASLTWANVDLASKEIRLVTRKTGKRLIVPIAEPLFRHLVRLPSADDPQLPLHPRAHSIVAEHGAAGSLSKQFANLLAAAGLREKQPHRKTHGLGRGVGSGKHEISFHALRHTAVTLMKEAGVPAAVVMELVGHDSEQISAHYTHVGADALRRAAESLPDILK